MAGMGLDHGHHLKSTVIEDPVLGNDPVVDQPLAQSRQIVRQPRHPLAVALGIGGIRPSLLEDRTR